MKLTVPFMAIAMLALGPLTSAKAQSSPARSKAVCTVHYIQVVDVTHDSYLEQLVPGIDIPRCIGGTHRKD